jgi:hypothetical protein
MTRAAERAALVALGLLLSAVPLPRAADWRFEPVLDVSAERTDNVQLDDPRLGEEAESDTIARASLRLGVVAETARSTFDFSYTPAHERFSDFSDFDNTSHSAGLGWNFVASPRATWSLDGGWDLRERTRVSLDEGAEQVDLISVGFSEQESWRARLQGLLTASERHRWVVALDGGGTSYEATEAIEALELADTTTAGAELAWETDLAERTTFGVMGRGTRLDEGFRGEWDIYDALLGLTFGSPERLQMTISAGVAVTSVRDPGEIEVEDEPTTETGRIALVREVGARTRLTATLAREVGGSRGSAGITQNDTASFRWSYRATARSAFAASANWTDREPLEVEAGLEDRGLRTLGVRAEYSYAFTRTLRLVLSAERIDQTTDSPELLEVDRTLYGLGLRWAPLAGRR